MSGNQTYTTRLLPANIWDALLGANAPSAANVFATMADLAAAATTIYTGNGTIGPARVATLTDTLNFVGAAGTTGIGIGTAVFAPTGIFEVRANDADGARFVGNSTIAGVAFTVRNSSSSLAIFNNVGLIKFAPVLSYTVTIGVSDGTAKLTVQGIGATLATVNQAWVDSALLPIASVRDDGRWGFNMSPVTGDRLSIRAGAGLDGAINISANNLADNGYSILVQGGTGSANYNGIWSDVATEGTGTNRGFRGSSLLSGGSSNYGAEFTARNGTSESIGVKGIASGGDSVNSTDSAGVLGINQSIVALVKKGVWGYTINNVDGGTDFGVKGEAGNSGVAAINYAGHFRANGVGAGRINTAGYFKADGGVGATNYAIVTDGGNSGFGTVTPSQQAMVHIVPGARAHVFYEPITALIASAIVPANGMGVYVSSTDATFITTGFWKYENALWSPW